ncbi:MAG: hypothetical protein ABI591_20500 [Kofleriaceae bacterium]
MTDRDLQELDPVLATAYQAEQRATADVVATAGITRDRVMLAVCDRVVRTSHTPAIPRRHNRVRWAIAGAVVAASIGYAAGRITAPAPVDRERSDAAVTPRPSPADAAPPEAPPIDAAAPDAPPANVTKPTAPTGSTKDSAEGLLLDQARAALRRSMPDDAAAALERHRQTFPNGQLREERDVLLIEVALLQDRRADANELIARYLDHYRNGSLRRHVVELQHQLDMTIRRQ